MTIKEKKERQQILTTAHFVHQKGLHTHAFFKTGNRAISKDLVQDTFMKTWNFIAKGGEVETMKAFLFHVLNGLIIDSYRKHKTKSLDVLFEQGFQPSVDESSKQMDVLDGKAAFLFINDLPKKYQKVMRMKYIQDLSLKEMSLITGQTKNTIAVQASRGLEKLRTLYKLSLNIIAI